MVPLPVIMPTEAFPSTMSLTAQIRLVLGAPTIWAVMGTVSPEVRLVGGLTRVMLRAGTEVVPWLPPELPLPPQATWINMPAMAKPCSVVMSLVVRNGTSACR